MQLVDVAPETEFSPVLFPKPWLPSWVLVALHQHQFSISSDDWDQGDRGHWNPKIMCKTYFYATSCVKISYWHCSKKSWRCVWVYFMFFPSLPGTEVQTNSQMSKAGKQGKAEGRVLEEIGNLMISTRDWITETFLASLYKLLKI